MISTPDKTAPFKPVLNGPRNLTLDRLLPSPAPAHNGQAIRAIADDTHRLPDPIYSPTVRLTRTVRGNPWASSPEPVDAQ